MHFTHPFLAIHVEFHAFHAKTSTKTYGSFIMRVNVKSRTAIIANYDKAVDANLKI